MNDDELAAFHDEIELRLNTRLKTLADRQRELMDEVLALKRETSKIETATYHEKWWELRAYLSPDEIESLCGISPRLYLLKF